MFANYPVVTHEKHRIRMEDIAEIDTKSESTDPTQKGGLFKQLMASINPFSKYILDECQ